MTSSSNMNENEKVNKKESYYNEESDLNFSKLNSEYDQCINELKQKLQISKELRKQSEINAKAIEHRILLLRNQEKYLVLQFLNTKKKVESILVNRFKANERLLQTDFAKSLKGSRASTGLKKSKSSNFLRRDVEDKERRNIEREKEKRELIDRLRKDEEERKRLEKEIALIEKEQLGLINSLGQEIQKRTMK